MDFSILISTRNRPAQLRQCIESLEAADLGDSCEIVIIDQSDQAAEWGDRASLRYYWRKDKGLSKARNEAVRLANGNILCFIDDDCLVAKDWLVNIRATYAAYPDADGVFGRVLAYARDGEQVVHHRKRTQYGEATFAEKPGPYVCSALFAKDEISIHDKPCLPVANLGSGNNMSFKHSVFDRHGLFITQLGPGGWLRSADDTEFHYRLLRANCKLIYTPHATVFHDRWMDLSQNDRLQDEYRIGVVATWFRYSLSGDRLAWSFLKHRWQGLTKEISANTQGKGFVRRIGCELKKRRSFLQGMWGGFAIYIMNGIRPASLYR
jgi:glycosyltransferase involved in cell wall biosynthesis